MSIEIIVGLPHLSEGPLLKRARAMGVPVLISANSLSRWKPRDGWREWAGWRLGTLANARGLRSLDLDSGGFSAMVRYNCIPWSVDDYMALAASFPFRRFASLDYCTEAAIAADREEVLDRIARTVRLNIECHTRAVDHGIISAFMPVIQGRLPEDYLRTLDGIAHLLRPGMVIGVGSTCRRPIHGREGLIAVYDCLDRNLPSWVRLHGFGNKGRALSYLAAFGDRIASIDSSAYGVSARQEALHNGRPKTDLLVADHMTRWIERQSARLSEARRFVQSEFDLPNLPPRANVDPWEVAIATAREEIRALIGEGEIDHDAMTAGWIEQWAADIYNSAG
ncbi:MAG: hypothetical protein H2055_04370 [Sphingopyxis sp.]|nr:hypothetical protein [Sphingopyxis sp.]